MTPPAKECTHELYAQAHKRSIAESNALGGYIDECNKQGVQATVIGFGEWIKKMRRK